MRGSRSFWWLAGAVLGALFVLANVVALLAVDGGVGQDVLGIGLGAVMTAAALAKYTGWSGVRS